ncbi:MAG: hypothetical protein C0592_10150 [Marinilabiliales bacterium]|nr:MAG: hypothetical protein C0592_10150 [Marinilabiliales bacterium]
MKKIIIYFTFLSLVTVISSCFDSYDTDECDYTDCNTTYPSEGTMRVKVTENPNGSGVPIAIYEGFFDNGILLERDTIYREEKSYYLSPEMYYSVVAEYESNGEIIHVVDGGRILVQANKMCDSVCYSVKNLTVNVKLKY